MNHDEFQTLLRAHQAGRVEMIPPVPAQKMTFEEWCLELNKIGAKYPDRYGPTPVESCGADSWFGYYECDYSPQDAWDEDGSYD